MGLYVLSLRPPTANTGRIDRSLLFDEPEKPLSSVDGDGIDEFENHNTVLKEPHL